MTISYSSISMYKECPYKYYQVYILGNRLDNRALRVGNITHSVIELILNDVIQEEHIREYVYSLDKLKNDDEREDVINILDVSLSRVKRSVENTEHDIEMKLNHQIDDDIRLTGKIDLLIKKDNEYTICDFKTSNPKPNGQPYKPDWLQLFIYAYLLRKNDIDKDFYGMFYFLKTNKHLKRKIEEKDIQYIETFIKNFLTVLKSVCDEKNIDDFPPKKNKWCYFCDFKNKCGIGVR